MALFPRIQNPCPLKGNLGDYMDGDVCRQCHRQVHDLDGLSSDERKALLQDCGPEICVSYRLPVRAALGAALIASSMQPAVVGAEEFNTGGDWVAESAANQVEDCETLQLIMVGGIKDTSRVEYIDIEADLAIPELEVVYEDSVEAGSGSES